MIQTATIKAILHNGNAIVQVIRQGACAHNCESCSGCGQEGQKIEIEVRNAIGAQVGDRVELESRNRTMLGAAALVYLIAPILFFLCYFITSSCVSDGLCAVFSVGAFFLGMFPAIVYDRRLKRNGGIEFNMVRVIEHGT